MLERTLSCTLLSAVWCCVSAPGWAGELSVSIEQITLGPKHHFFGYIGHVRTIPWNESGQYIVALRAEFQDHLPRPSEAAEIILIDTRRDNAITVVDRTLAWNLQQGTMLYWNPRAPDTQFFFNDRDPRSGHVFPVLFDIGQGAAGRRVREYRYADTPLGNSGVAQQGGYFLGLNYGRLARLRPVTGYAEAFDWTEEEVAPASDGVFKVDVLTGQKTLLVSYRRLQDVLREKHPDVDEKALFINHTLPSRDDDRIYFFARADFESKEGRLDVPFTVRSDGSELTMQGVHIGGHPEWEFGSRMIGVRDDRQVIYDTLRQEVVGTIGTPAIFPKPGGDVALSPDGKWFVNGYRRRAENYYVILRRRDAAHVRTRGFDHEGWTSGPLRLDPAPCWNRQGNQILVPGIADDAKRTRQLFLIRVLPTRTTGG